MKKSAFSTLIESFPDSVQHSARAFFEADATASDAYQKLKRDRGNSPTQKAAIAKALVTKSDMAGRKFLSTLHNCTVTSNAAIHSRFAQALPSLPISDAACVLGLANTLNAQAKAEFLKTETGIRALDALGGYAAGLSPSAVLSMRESYLNTKFPDLSAELKENAQLTERAGMIVKDHLNEIKAFDHIIQNPDVESATDYDI